MTTQDNDLKHDKIIEMTKIYSNPKSNKKIIFAIDNDECIGSWADLSLLYSMYLKEMKHELRVELFVDIMEKTKCARPYLKDFLNKLIDLKKQGIIYKIFMFTAASNVNGWVSFLSKVIEQWMGINFYDGIICKEMIEDWHIEKKTKYCNNIGYIKNMDIIKEIINLDSTPDDNFHFVAIDDRPDNIVNGIPIGVSPFKVAINIIEVIKMYLPEKYNYLVSKYYVSLQMSWNMFRINPYYFTDVGSDIDILKSIDCVDKIIISIL